MTPQHFQTQIERLRNQFGKQTYSQERATLLWSEVRDLPDDWFTFVVNRFIGECRQPPLLPEFREEVTKERERIWKTEKEKHRQESKQAMGSMFSKEDIQTICKGITSRIRGGMNDGDFKTFNKMLRSIEPIGECRYCKGSGLAFITDENQYEWVYRCVCKTGGSKSNYPRVNVNLAREA